MNDLVSKSLACVAAMAIGFIVRLLAVPSPAPMTLFGCLLVLCMTLGHMLGGFVIP